MEIYFSSDSNEMCPTGKICINEDQVMFDSQRDDLTSVSPVYREDSPVQQRAASLLNLLVYYKTDPALSGVRGLISELKLEQHSLHL